MKKRNKPTVESLTVSMLDAQLELFDALLSRYLAEEDAACFLMRVSDQLDGVDGVQGAVDDRSRYHLEQGRRGASPLEDLYNDIREGLLESDHLPQLSTYEMFSRLQALEERFYLGWLHRVVPYHVGLTGSDPADLGPEHYHGRWASFLKGQPEGYVHIRMPSQGSLRLEDIFDPEPSNN